MGKRKTRRKPTNNKHHRRCRSNGGSDNPENISIVPIVKHRAYHTLFDNKTVPEIAKELNETWIDPDWVLIPVHKESGISLSQIKKYFEN